MQELTMQSLMASTQDERLAMIRLDAALAFQNTLWDRSERRARPKTRSTTEVIQLGLRSLKVSGQRHVLGTMS